MHSWMHTSLVPGGHPFSGRTRFLHPVCLQVFLFILFSPPGPEPWPFQPLWVQPQLLGMGRPLGNGSRTHHLAASSKEEAQHCITASLRTLVLKETMQTPWGGQGQQVLDGRMTKQIQEVSSFPEKRTKSTSKLPRSRTGIPHPKNGRKTGGIWVSFAA